VLWTLLRFLSCTRTAPFVLLPDLIKVHSDSYTKRTGVLSLTVNKTELKADSTALRSYTCPVYEMKARTLRSSALNLSNSRKKVVRFMSQVASPP
jgi:hypothetical protein